MQSIENIERCLRLEVALLTSAIARRDTRLAWQHSTGVALLTWVLGHRKENPPGFDEVEQIEEEAAKELDATTRNR